jgi:hypothetical protein
MSGPGTKSVSGIENSKLLSEADMERIRREEIFRAEVRTSLQPPRTAAQKVFDFLNSSLGVFVLSAILLGGLSTGFTKWLEGHQKRSQDQETIRRLDIEIAYRIQQLTVLPTGVISYTQLNTAKGALLGKSEVDPRVGTLGEFYPIFPDYVGRTLFFLIWELRSTVPADQRSQLDAPLLQSKSLLAFCDRMVMVKAVGGEDSQWTMSADDRRKFELAMVSLQLSRWKV